MEPSQSLTLYSVINAASGVSKICSGSVVGEIGIVITSTIVPVFPIYGPQSIFTCCPIFTLVLYHKKRTAKNKGLAAGGGMFTGESTRYLLAWALNIGTFLPTTART